MRLGILVRDARYQRPAHTTMHLARAALELGHEVFFLGVGHLTLGERPGELRAQAQRLPPELSPVALCHELLDERLPFTTLDLTTLELLLVRFNPAAREPYALEPGLWWPALQVAQQLAARGVAVVNSPAGLQRHLDKLHTRELPAGLGLPGLVTRDPAEIDRYQAELGGQPLVIKPLAGSGGSDVFLLDGSERANRDQILETVCAAGYALVQPFLPQGLQGDLRVLLLDGEPLLVEGQVAAYRRKGREGRLRNNIHAGGQRAPEPVSLAELAPLAPLAPYLRERGLRCVGVDLLGDRVLEVNAFCPGGIENINRTCQVDVAPAVIAGLVGPAGSAPGPRAAGPGRLSTR